MEANVETMEVQHLATGYKSKQNFTSCVQELAHFYLEPSGEAIQRERYWAEGSRRRGQNGSAGGRTEEERRSAVDRWDTALPRCSPNMPWKVRWREVAAGSARMMKCRCRKMARVGGKTHGEPCGKREMTGIAGKFRDWERPVLADIVSVCFGRAKKLDKRLGHCWRRQDTRRIPPRGVRIDLAPLLQIQPRRPCSRRLLEA
ncbi:hypothetical protein PVAP13_3NG127600 [Panicum virgatum]|uniref:Uncharacterized protein n=1 Tax=Panicum virgatum TaxID=38727 RepID=A0A8T0UCF7_PANVG|nr:hypothetical protein PVAP13_3NG127600 [Panicum virgatum]